MIVEQKFDNCENAGLQHSWRLFEITQRWREETRCITNSTRPIETPVQENPLPFIKKETTHVRRCQNCTREELFEIEEVRKWVRK